ncbi:hypothetical protein [Deinococcus metallilatus]|uniref:Uncharacterized protein n=1 Tax=Deinococcus metallilatus TaxID=1211322 RepID=A0AAJ5JYI7_9DEIO|nr:hypothetical protein [Deinococcus metallilatus]MBB5297415.1 hypothetical protein [Deinococcus metallilatus]RXJ08056.1 hypothetical protein ERJ73_19450 [Deinococcus metallilatus]TLK20822.1 hypothetical protein FCS05_19830 [Deinococcus metallilatus]GMA17023.1 hypothetical protein GCM10025871_33540 [Deinococcus metallilatus]
MPHPDPSIEAIAKLLEGAGHSREEALALAEEAVGRSRTVSEGCTYGGLHPEGLAQLWNTAAKNGKRRLVLEIAAEGMTPDEYTGHIGVKVLEAEEWSEWSETDYLARNLAAPHVWTPEEGRSSWPFKEPLADLLDLDSWEEQGPPTKKRDSGEMN